MKSSPGTAFKDIFRESDLSFAYVSAVSILLFSFLIQVELSVNEVIKYSLIVNDRSN